MPEMNGVEATRIISKELNIPVKEYVDANSEKFREFISKLNDNIFLLWSSFIFNSGVNNSFIQKHS